MMVNLDGSTGVGEFKGGRAPIIPVHDLVPPCLWTVSDVFWKNVSHVSPVMWSTEHMYHSYCYSDKSNKTGVL